MGTTTREDQYCGGHSQGRGGRKTIALLLRSSHSDFAQIHPYTSVAWSVVSAGYEVRALRALSVYCT